MKLIYYPNFVMPVETVAPDNFEENTALTPNDNFVISRDINGNTVSIYGDKCWNRTAYSQNGKSSWLRFPFYKLDKMNSLQTSIHKESKWIMFLLMWHRQGNPLSQDVLKRYSNFLQVLGNYCYSKNIEINYFFNNINQIKEFSNIIVSQSYFNNLNVIISELRKLPSEIEKYKIPKSKDLLFLNQKLLKTQLNYKQTAPIPTRIYSGIIFNISKEIEQFINVSDDLFNLTRKCIEYPYYGRSISTIFKSTRTTNIRGLENTCSFQQALKIHNLLSYFDDNNIDKSIQGLSCVLSKIQLLIKLQVHIYTGMRDSEVDSIPYDCLEKKVFNGVSHYLINGFTTKFNNGIRKKVSWVTSEEGFKAIKTIQKIADLIYSCLDIKDKEKPLFISTAYLPLNSSKKIVDSNKLTTTNFQFNRHSYLINKITPIIEEEDIIELENIDMHRSWRNEQDYQIGKVWPIRTHQLRRSLALYAQRTGLVSLPSLRRQLKHITNEMSMYYAKGSSYANNLITQEKDHFGKEWQEAQPVSSALSYIANVLLSEDKLVGGHGNWVEHTLKNNNTVIIETREETIKRFKRGEISYKETLIGGCTKVGSCDQIALNWLDSECLTKGCKNMVCSVSKLDKIIIAQKNLVDSLEIETLEYRSEKADLGVLVSAKNKLIKDKI